MNYRGLMRQRLIEQLYDKMNDEEKRLFIQLTMQDRDYREIMQALNELKQKSDQNHHSFTSDLLANIAGNGIFDGIVYLFSRFLKRI